MSTQPNPASFHARGSWAWCCAGRGGPRQGSLCWPDQLRRVERLERVDGLDRLRLHVPFELAEQHSVRREVNDREAVLLDRLYLLVHIEMCRRERSSPAPPRRPAAGPR